MLRMERVGRRTVVAMAAVGIVALLWSAIGRSQSLSRTDWAGIFTQTCIESHLRDHQQMAALLQLRVPVEALCACAGPQIVSALPDDHLSLMTMMIPDIAKHIKEVELSATFACLTVLSRR